jgi:hypothetical protein
VTASAWLVSARFDLLVFSAPALAALALAAASGTLADAGETPTWAWLLFVVGIDVAHVHGTTLRVYLDRGEFARRGQLYTLVPLLGFASSVLAYSASPATFWRCLAYLALFHFVRQQIGWTRLYRRRAQDRSRFDARLDEATVYAATLYPVVVWHTRLPVDFHWFMPGDFIAGLPLWAASAARAVWGAVLLAFAARQIQRGLRGEPVAWGKLLLVGTTAASWWCGIVWFANDFAFTITNGTCGGLWHAAGGRKPVLRGERHVEISTSPLGVGRADAPRLRPRRAGVPTLWGAATVDRDGRGPRGNPRDPRRARRVARAGRSGAAVRASAEHPPRCGDRRLSTP